MNTEVSGTQTDLTPGTIARKRILIVTGALAVCMSAMASNAFAQSSITQSRDRYRALQNLSYEFGSKFASGYFEARAGACLVTLMVIERRPPDEPLPLTAARLRLTLNPGHIAGLDSEEGVSLNFTCGEGATTLLVDVGERRRLMELQELALGKTAAK
jgi:hypothetical protein